MTLTTRRLAAFGLVVCLQAMAACSSRRIPVDAPEAPQPDRVPESSKPVVTPEPAMPPAPPPAPPASGADAASIECSVIAEPGDPITTVALSDRVDPANAPRPTNEGERLLFRQLYETLARADCAGRVVPGLAASWQLEADARTWMVTLRDGASFSDGTPVTSAHVRASWMRDAVSDELRPQVDRLVESIVSVSEWTLAITLRSRRVDAPVALAHPDLAIARPATDSSWPLGTRSSWITAGGSSARPGPPAIGTTTITVGREDGPPIRFVVAQGDPRDVLDEGVDLLITRDPAALDYASTLPHFQSVPLAWERIRVLLAPARQPSSPILSDEARQTLADDAVRGEAQGARSPFWWQELPDCEVAAPSSHSRSSLTPRIVYDAGDAAARDLAERFVGLGHYQRATGLTGVALSQARQLGGDAGYLMSLDRHPLDPCRELQALMDRVRWLDPDAIVPLVETRLRAIVRRGRSGITAEWDGGLIIAGGNDFGPR